MEDEEVMMISAIANEVNKARQDYLAAQQG